MITPLPRRDAVVDLLASRGRPLTSRELAARLHVTETSYPGFLRFLEALAQEGALREVGKDRYSLEGPAWRRPEGVTEREGTLRADARGFGFVRSVGFSDDLYVPEQAMGGALHGDTVLARPVRRSSLGFEGEIVRIVKRGAHRIAGVLRRRGKSAWLEPDDGRVRGPLVLRGVVNGVEGEAAVALITRFPELPDENPEGELVATLGTPGDPNVEVAKVLLRQGIDEQPPAAATEEAEAYGDEVTSDALVGREDLTGVPLPTIDPEDARDHDDAVWVERADDGTYTAWIAIADVSHYVRPETAIDAAARERGTSIYLPDRAIPMLPRALSSNLCSLLPDKLRLCLCAIVRLDPGGNILDTRLVRGFMRSKAKLNYGGVARALGFTQKPPKQKAAEELVDALRVADTLSQILRTKRLRRGALDFALPEPKVVLDPKTGAPIGVERRAEDPGVRRAYQLIEELMLLGNEVVAKFLVDRGIATIFRVHAPPDEEKLERFATLCEEVGLTFESADAADPKRLSAFLRKVSKHPRAEVLNMLLLRAMKQASYDVANIGHFGLASPAYLHFTSPIRRYPDLVVHRIVKQVLADADAHHEPMEQTDEDETALKESAQIASDRERKAMEVEREVVDLYRALYMRAFIGETYEGTVTGLVGSGAFVSLDSPFVDVMVRADAMGKDQYELDDDRMKFVGRRSGDSLSLGDRVVVTIEDVALLRRMVYAWRHAPDLADRGPLRHTPFRADERPAKPKAKKAAQAAASTSANRKALDKRKAKPPARARATKKRKGKG
jgi:ribonuclease R